MGTINSSMQAVQQAQADLGYADNPPPLGHDLVSLLSSRIRKVRLDLTRMTNQICLRVVRTSKCLVKTLAVFNTRVFPEL